MNFWWIKCKIVHTVLGHIKWSAIGLYFEDPVFFFLTMLHIWWFVWFVAAVFENTRTCVRKSRGKCFPSSRGRGENCSLCALLLLLILLSTLFSFPVTYKDGQSLLWKWSLFQWSACCQLLSVQFGSLIKSFFFHIQTVVESVPRQSGKKVLLSKKGNHSGMQLKCKEADRDDSLLYFYIE